MSEFTDDDREMLVGIKTVLVGMNGDPGLVGEFSILSKTVAKLRKNFWTLVGILVGSGILGTGIGLLTG